MTTIASTTMTAVLGSPMAALAPSSPSFTTLPPSTQALHPDELPPLSSKKTNLGTRARQVVITISTLVIGILAMASGLLMQSTPLAITGFAIITLGLLLLAPRIGIPLPNRMKHLFQKSHQSPPPPDLIRSNASTPPQPPPIYSLDASKGERGDPNMFTLAAPSFVSTR